jgi:hypothetical protein
MFNPVAVSVKLGKYPTAQTNDAFHVEAVGQFGPTKHSCALP